MKRLGILANVVSLLIDIDVRVRAPFYPDLRENQLTVVRPVLTIDLMCANKRMFASAIRKERFTDVKRQARG